MSFDHEKELLDKEIMELNDEIQRLGYKLSELLNLDCNFGLCSFDPEVDNVQEKMQDISEKKHLLEFIRKNIESYKKPKSQ